MRLIGFGSLARFELRDVNSAPAVFLRTIQRQRFRHAAHVDVLQVAMLADEVENDALCPQIAKPLQLRVLRARGGLVEDRVKKELALLEAPAGQPLDLQKELRAEAAEKLFGLSFVAFEEKRGQHSLATRLCWCYHPGETLHAPCCETLL